MSSPVSGGIVLDKSAIATQNRVAGGIRKVDSLDNQRVTGGFILTAIANQGITDHGRLNGLTADDHPQYLTQTRGDARYRQLSVPIPLSDIPAEIARDTEVSAAIAAHEAAADPHSQYLTQSEGDGRYYRPGTTINDSDIPGSIARDSEVSGAIAAHTGASDPHPQYLTQAEGDSRYYQQGTLVDSDIPATIARDVEVAAAVSAHESALDPHSQYFTQTEGDARYRRLTEAQGIDTITGLELALNGKQNADDDLTAFAALNTVGFVRRTGNGTAEARALQLGDIPDISGTYQTASGFSAHTGNTGNGSHIPGSGITNSNVAAGAAIDWAKISKTGAVPGDVGAQPANANLTTVAAANLAIDLGLYSDSTPFTEFFPKDGSPITRAEVWDSAAKVTLLKTTTFTYSGGNLTQIVTTDGTVTRTRTIAYSGGNIATITGS